MDYIKVNEKYESEIKPSDLFEFSIKSSGDNRIMIDETLKPRVRRSAKLSHISGTSRKIQIFIKKHFLQILPDGSVNGTQDDTSEYSKYPITGHWHSQIFQIFYFILSV